MCQPELGAKCASLSSPGRLVLSNLNPLMLLTNLILPVHQHTCPQVAPNMHVSSMKDAKYALKYSSCVPWSMCYLFVSEYSPTICRYQALESLLCLDADQAGGESLKSAVDLVAKLQDPALTSQLIHHLQGLQQGAVSLQALQKSAPADKSTYLVLLYMALRRHEEAAEVAVGLARSLQEAGEYKVCSNNMLLPTCTTESVVC